MTALLVLVFLAGQAPRPHPPLDVVLLVDVSTSMTRAVITRDRTLLQDAASALAASLQPGDGARVGTFGSEITLDAARLRDAAAVQSAAEALASRTGGASPIWDALIAAVSSFGDAPGRRGIVLVTDGKSTGNRAGFTEALERVQRAGIPMFVVVVDKGGRPVPDPGARLIRLAAATGATCLFVERKALVPGVARALTMLRAAASATAR